MALKLLKMIEDFCGELPPLANGLSRVTTYEGGERIHVMLGTREMYEARIEVQPDDIERLAKEVFPDVNYQFYDDFPEEGGPSIFFEPRPGTGNYERERCYDHHSISVHTQLITPEMTIYLIDGRLSLEDEQRTRYVSFVEKLYMMSERKLKSVSESGRQKGSSPQS